MSRGGANRKFALIFAAAFAMLGVLSFRAGRESDIAWWSLAAAFLTLALLVPRVLAPARRVWLALGRWLGLLTNPIVLGVVYAFVFVPVAGVMRLLGRDAMARTRDVRLASYWICRNGGPIDAESLKQQF